MIDENLKKKNFKNYFLMNVNLKIMYVIFFYCYR